jgi:hypothetical protein
MLLLNVLTYLHFNWDCLFFPRSFLNSVCKNQISTIAQKYWLAMEGEHEGIGAGTDH